MDRNTVQLIDDNAKTRRRLRAGFEAGGYNVVESSTAADGLQMAVFRRPDLILLEPILPDLPGTEVLERIRAWSNVPIIILSIFSSEEQKIRLLRLGADDCVAKPFGMGELLARSEAVLRRYFKTPNESHLVTAGRLCVDLATRTVALNGKVPKLTRNEHRLVNILAMHAGFVVPHDRLLEEVWPRTRGDIQYLRILVRKLRQKIETDPDRPSILVTHSGIGYRLDNQATAPESIQPERARVQLVRLGLHPEGGRRHHAREPEVAEFAQTKEMARLTGRRATRPPPPLL